MENGNTDNVKNENWQHEKKLNAAAPELRTMATCSTPFDTAWPQWWPREAQDYY